jgi:hypothetical protein
MHDLPVDCVEYTILDNVRFEYDPAQGYIRAYAIVDGDDRFMYSLVVDEFIDLRDFGYTVMFTSTDSAFYYIRSVDKTDPRKQIDAILQGINNISIVADIIELIYA